MLLKCRTNYAYICYYVKQITDDNFSCFCTFLISWTYIWYTLVIRWNLQCDSDGYMFVIFACISEVPSLHSKRLGNTIHNSPTIVMYSFIVVIYSMYVPIYCRYVHRIIHTVTPNPNILSNVSIVKSVVRTWFVRLTHSTRSAGAPLNYKMRTRKGWGKGGECKRKFRWHRYKKIVQLRRL